MSFNLHELKRRLLQVKCQWVQFSVNKNYTVIHMSIQVPMQTAL